MTNYAALTLRVGKTDFGVDRGGVCFTFIDFKNNFTRLSAFRYGAPLVPLQKIFSAVVHSMRLWSPFPPCLSTSAAIRIPMETVAYVPHPIISCKKILLCTLTLLNLRMHFGRVRTLIYGADV